MEQWSVAGKGLKKKQAVAKQLDDALASGQVSLNQLLAAAKRAEDVFYGFSDDERADRAAAPLLLGLPTMAAAAAFGWACSRCFLPVQ